MKNNRTTLIKAKKLSLIVALLGVLITLGFAPTSAHRDATDTGDPLNWVFWIASFGWIAGAATYSFCRSRLTAGTRISGIHDDDCVTEHCGGECMSKPASVVRTTVTEEEDGDVCNVQY